jgi:hypothetical protein
VHKIEEKCCRLTVACTGNGQPENTNRIYGIIKARCIDNERQNMCAGMSCTASVTFYSSVKYVLSAPFGALNVVVAMRGEV